MFNIFIGLNTLLFLTLITSIYYEIKHELKYLLNEKKDIFLYDYFFCKNIIFICLVITILTILAINYNIIKRNFLILTVGNVTLIIIYKYVFTINTILFTILEYVMYLIIIVTLVVFDINKNKIKKIAVLVSWLFISLPISIILCYYQHKYINQFNTNDYFNLIPYKNKIILKTLIYIDIILKIGIYPNFKSIQSLRQNNNESIVLFINNMLDSIIILRVLFFYNFFINSNNDILILILLVVKFKFFLEIKKTNLKFNKKIIIFLNQKTIEILILLILSNFNKFNLLTLLIVLKTLYSILLIILLWLNKYRFFIFKSLTKINSNLLNVKYIKPSISINIYLRILLVVINTFGWFINTVIVLHFILNQFDLFNFIILSIVIILNNLNINYLLFDIILTLSINSKSISSNLSNHETIIIFLIILIFIEVIL